MFGAEFSCISFQRVQTLDERWTAKPSVPAKFGILNRPANFLPSVKIRAAPLLRFVREVWLEPNGAKKPDDALTYRTWAGLVGTARNPETSAGDFGMAEDVRASLDYVGFSLTSVHHLITAEGEQVDLTLTPPKLVQKAGRMLHKKPKRAAPEARRRQRCRR